MSEAEASPRVVTELKVSGHLMTLDAGVFCLFHAPGSTLANPATGLPGVRLSLPPAAGAAAAGGAAVLAIRTFGDDGWLGGQDSAALIRVSRGPAQVLVTVYQELEGRQEAPRLQVMRLSGAAGAVGAPATGGVAAAGMAAVGAGVAPAAPSRASGPASLPAVAAPVPAPAAAVPRPVAPPAGVGGAAGAATPAGPVAPAAAGVAPGGGATPGAGPQQAEVAAHVQGRGDVLARLGEWMGEPGSQRWVEGFAIAPRGRVEREDIEYQAVLGRGWMSPWASAGTYCGSRGMALPILGLRVRLRGAAAARFECSVRATFVDGSAAGPSAAGEALESASLAPLEAFRVEISEHARAAGHAADAAAAGPAPGAAGRPARAAGKRPVRAATATPAGPGAGSGGAVAGRVPAVQGVGARPRGRGGKA